jgi:phosphatidylserine/phosphatidylglycerophosphate/cardiolipin synthase-like enzyme
MHQLLRALLLLLLTACASPEGSIRLIETRPLETSLGSEDLPDYHAVWLEMIDGSQKSLDLAYFYASNEAGSRLESVILAIEAAASRGVQVRFLADVRFHGTYPDTLDRLSAMNGCEVRLLDLTERTGGVLHAKLLLADGERTCLGSANFDWRSLEHIQELGVDVRSKAITEALGSVFELDWALAAGQSNQETLSTERPFPVALHAADHTEVLVTPVVSPQDLLSDMVEWDLPHLLSWIDGAEDEVLLQVLTFRMQGRDGERFEAMESALLRAAARGVKVRLLVSDWCKRSGTIEDLQALARIPNVHIRMMTIPPAERGHIPFARVIHAKYLVVDRSRGWIGSSNWERSYFHESRNVGLLLEGGSFAERMARYFEEGWTSRYAYKLDPEATYLAPRVGE